MACGRLWWCWTFVGITYSWFCRLLTVDFEWLSGYGHVTSMQIRWFLSVFRSYGHVLLIVTQMTVYIWYNHIQLELVHSTLWFKCLLLYRMGEPRNARKCLCLARPVMSPTVWALMIETILTTIFFIIIVLHCPICALMSSLRSPSCISCVVSSYLCTSS